MPQMMESPTLPSGFTTWTDLFRTMGPEEQVEFVQSLSAHEAVALDYIQREETSRLAQESLNPFSSYLDPHYPPAEHHRAMNCALEALDRGEIKRLMVFAPPGAAKTTYVSVRYPAFYLGRHPGHSIIFGTHTSEFAEEIGGKVRDVVSSDQYEEIFKCRVSSASRAMIRWQLTNGGEWRGVGVGQAVSGRRANGLIFDDTIKSFRDSQSPTVRQGVFEWYRSDMKNRMMPESWIAMIHTRWHVSDLPGCILPAKYDGRSGWVRSADGSEWWYVLNFPMLAERFDDPVGRKPGERLWPGWFSEAYVKVKKIDQGPYNWASLYQQRPMVAGGTIMKRDWFNVVRKPPEKFDRVVRYWDFASTEQSVRNEDPDWTVGCKMGVLKGRYTVLDVVRFRGSPATVEDRVKSTAWKDGREIKQWLEQEPGSSGKTVVEHYVRTVLQGLSAGGQRATGSKVARADVLASAAENGNVDVLAAPWNEAFLDEMEVFNKGDHDDQVDAASGAVSKLIRKKTAGTWGKKTARGAVNA